MTPLADWLTRLLHTGESVQAAPPDPADRSIVTVLREAHAAVALDMAGPPLPFDADAAENAALSLAEACWHLVGERPDAAPPRDRLGVPRSPAAHLSADLTLRFLPAVYRRARPRGADDALAGWAEAVLRRWPLSGVLAGIAAGPAACPDFHSHAGLELLYAERLADHPHPAWLPPPGRLRDLAHRAFAERGKPLPVPPTEAAL